MKTIKWLLVIVSLVIISGCQTKSNDSFTWYKLKSNMTKSEVISTLGLPDSVRVSDDKTEEILVYKRTQPSFSIFLPLSYRYEIFLKNDKYVRLVDQVGF